LLAACIACRRFSSYHPDRVAPDTHDADDKQRLVSAAPVEDDASFELKLRPQRLC